VEVRLQRGGGSPRVEREVNCGDGMPLLERVRSTGRISFVFARVIANLAGVKLRPVLGKGQD